MSEEQLNETPDQTEGVVVFGIHIMLTEDGAFAMRATGKPNLGDMQMLLSRALASVEARMSAETTVALMNESQQSKRIITPGR